MDLGTQRGEPGLSERNGDGGETETVPFSGGCNETNGALPMRQLPNSRASGGLSLERPPDVFGRIQGRAKRRDWC